jgi:hypothetical protein
MKSYVLLLSTHPTVDVSAAFVLSVDVFIPHHDYRARNNNYAYGFDFGRGMGMPIILGLPRGRIG